MNSSSNPYALHYKIVATYVALLFVSSCIDPVPPEFEYKEGLVFVESIASTVPKASFVTISRSGIEFGVYVVRFVAGATVNFENVLSGVRVPLVEARNTYQPPEDFLVRPGEQWILNIQLPDGKTIVSTPETVLEPVPLSSIEVRYDPELVFKDNLGGKVVPGHEVSVNFDDPGDRDNYYYWSYRTYENIDFCEKCEGGVFRDGECMAFSTGGRGRRYFDYACDVDCWRIRFPENVAVFDDRFSNGKTISKLSVGEILLYTKENMVVEVQQFSLTPAAYDYYKVLNDIIDNNGGLNAPPPAALVGNLSNPNDGDDFVFGRFTAAATSAASLFIMRSDIEEQVIERRDPIVTEQFGDPLPPPITTIAPCSENKYRTAVRPVEWVDQ